MNRFHIHITVKNLQENIRYYTQLFSVAPVKEKDDYAKWTLDDPRINFAISVQDGAVGVNHLGMQLKSAEDLESWRSRADMASLGKITEQKQVDCCYANSDKYWTIDPQGVAWEYFHTLSDVEVFGSGVRTESNNCCVLGQSTGRDADCCQQGL